jgi:hypothetical protein
MNVPNRKDRRAQASKARSASARAIAAATARPARHVDIDQAEQNLQEMLRKIQEVNNENFAGVQRGFYMTDAHLQVHHKVLRQLAASVIASGTFVPELKVLPTTGDEDPALDLDAYYRELQELREKAGPLGDLASVYWQQGATVEEAFEKAQAVASEHAKTAPVPVSGSDEDYAVEYFGGNHDQSSPKQEPAPAEAGG